MRQGTVLVFGSINLDLHFSVATLPQPGQTLLCQAAPGSGPDEDGRVEPGGKGANQAVAAAQDGAAVTFAGAVGEDVLADHALSGLRRAGVECSLVARVPRHTGRAGITVDCEGRNTIVVAAGANALAQAGQVDDAALDAADWLLLQMETDPEQNAALIRRARNRNTRIMLNLAPARPLAPDALRAVDLLIGNSDEIGWLGERLGTGGNAASVQAALGVGVVRTLSGQGMEAALPEGAYAMRALNVPLRDSTGAGDCFAGVLAAGLARGMSVQDALRRAGVAAAISVTRAGSQNSLPQAHETEAALATAPRPERI